MKICGLTLRDDWRNAPHFISIRAAGLQAALLVAWAQMPDDLKQALPHWLLPAIAFFILIVGTVGIMVKQKGLPNDTSHPGQ